MKVGHTCTRERRTGSPDWVSLIHPVHGTSRRVRGKERLIALDVEDNRGIRVLGELRNRRHTLRPRPQGRVRQDRINRQIGYRLGNFPVIGRHHHPAYEIQLQRTRRNPANKELTGEETKGLMGESGRAETGRNHTEELHGQR